VNLSSPVFSCTLLGIAGMHSGSLVQPQARGTGQPIHYYSLAEQREAQQAINSVDQYGVPRYLQVDAKHSELMTANINQRLFLQSFAASAALMPGAPEEVRQAVRNTLQSAANMMEWACTQLLMGPNVLPAAQQAPSPPPVHRLSGDSSSSNNSK
jgi:hypothetical protein